MSGAKEERKLAAIMFTDMVGYSALTQRNEALALELLHEHRRLLRELFPKFGGREVETTGDGFLVEFASALEAARCAIEIQRAIATRNLTAPQERQIQVRIGIHVGDVVHQDGHVLGDGVNIAARLQPLAEPGGICISVDVARQVQNNLQAAVVKVGEAELKNIRLPMEICRIVLPWEKGEAPAASPKANVPREPGSSLKTKVIVAVGALVFIDLLLATLFLNQHPKPMDNAPTPKAPAQATSAQKSVAVLPFVNMSADKEDEYLSDGMTEELLNALAKVKGLRVPGRSSSFAFKGQNEKSIFRQVGEQLHVNAVLEGSVRKAGDKLRFTAQLINVTDGYHLWSDTYDADMKDILAVQSDVAQRVVKALEVQLGVDEARNLAQRPPENPEAHRLYLLGRYHFAKGTGSGITNALQYYNQALQLDPSYALAYCGLADSYGFMGCFQLSGREAWAKEMEMAKKALALDPELADAHVSLGIALASIFDWRSGEHEFKRALQSNPNLSLAYDQYAFLLVCHGRLDEAIAESKKAVALDPLSALINSNLAWWYYEARRYQEAIAQARKTLDLDPSFASAHSELGWCLLCTGDTAGALVELKKAKSLDSGPYNAGCLGYAYARSGDRTQAEQTLTELSDLAKRRYVSPFSRVMIYVGLGEKEKALEWLDKSYEEQDQACWILKVDQLYDSIRSEPRFQALLKKVGLDQ